ncbi:MAG: TolC family protein [Phycisphaerae bacterium]|nr:TolC family protein [Phycisphaerae bacterium]
MMQRILALTVFAASAGTFLSPARGQTESDASAPPAERSTPSGVIRQESGEQVDVSAAQARAVAALNMSLDRLEWHVPDPTDVETMTQRWLEDGRQRRDDTAVQAAGRIAPLVQQISRSNSIYMTLEDALHRALINNYQIDSASYGPAIATSSVVAAAAAFDATLAGSVTKNKVDRPTGSQLLANDLDQFNSSVGVTKLLPIGTQVTAQYGLERTFTSLAFQQINPEYFSDFMVELRQPLLRGFGLDRNLAELRIRKKEKGISDLDFRIQVRDTLADVERLYWRLMFARRDVVITARKLAEFEAIYQYLEARKDFDIMPVQLNATESRLEASRFEFVRRKTNLRNAQDELVAALNDPTLNLIDDFEIIPVGLPDLTLVDMDRIASVQAALEHNPEVLQQKLRLDIAGIQVGVARNEELPALDLTFRWTIDGLGGSADNSFDQLTMWDYMEYFVGVQFSMPIGNRARRAGTTSAKLSHSQAASQLKYLFERVILGVNTAIREMQTAYEQIPPTFNASEATEREVESIVARAERKDLNTLNSELAARINLADARRAMLNAMIDYNLAMIEVERAKGTLLEYYHVVISNDGD